MNEALYGHTRVTARRMFYGIQAPALVTGRAFASIEEQARCCVDAVRRLRPAGPYNLGGWSMGGIVSYEMARQLCEAGEDIELPEDVEPDDMRAVRLFVANVLAIRRYRPEPYPGPALFLAEEKRSW